MSDMPGDFHAFPAAGAGGTAGGVIADEGADGGEGGGDAEAGEEIRKRGGKTEVEELLGAGGAVGAEEFDEVAVGRDEALGGVDHEREEADEKCDRDDAGETGADPEDEDRCDDDDGCHLQDHQVGIEADAEERGEGEDGGGDEADEDGEAEAEQGAFGGIEGGGGEGGGVVAESFKDGARRGEEEAGVFGEEGVDGIPRSEEDDAGEGGEEDAESGRAHGSYAPAGAPGSISAARRERETLVMRS